MVAPSHLMNSAHVRYQWVGDTPSTKSLNRSLGPSTILPLVSSLFPVYISSLVCRDILTDASALNTKNFHLAEPSMLGTARARIQLAPPLSLLLYRAPLLVRQARPSAGSAEVSFLQPSRLPLQTRNKSSDPFSYCQLDVPMNRHASSLNDPIPEVKQGLNQQSVPLCARVNTLHINRFYPRISPLSRTKSIKPASSTIVSLYRDGFLALTFPSRLFVRPPKRSSHTD
ncbi:hypothetical protein FNV43_RR06488 [Rhamnella rubrinervis]|uniref:Uncharacterized protein n=1 Tax=Rhamnella rubrinervis TaxID=2594499 RepID=A0A8K0HD18_9ROSA|nr:hypothetical protein FNV43_RR06488 [Rhamnella rubrinervis]